MVIRIPDSSTHRDLILSEAVGFDHPNDFPEIGAGAQITDQLVDSPVARKPPLLIAPGDNDDMSVETVDVDTMLDLMPSRAQQVKIVQDIGHFEAVS